MLIWTALHPQFDLHHLGFLPELISDLSPKGAAEQLAQNYIGGWNPIKMFLMDINNVLRYPGDPPLHPLAKATLRDETLFLYRSSWVAIVQPNGFFEVSRID